MRAWVPSQKGLVLLPKRGEPLNPADCFRYLNSATWSWMNCVTDRGSRPVSVRNVSVV